VDSVAIRVRKRAPGAGVCLVVVLRVLDLGQAELLEVGLAGGAAGVLAHLLEDRKQDGGKNGNNGNHDEQLDERETSGLPTTVHDSDPLFGWYI